MANACSINGAKAPRKARGLKRDGLNIVPFIDVMLVLLAIVLSVSTFIAQGKIALELPKAESGVADSEQKRVKLAIDEQNRYYIDDEEVSLDTLRARVEKVSPKTLIELRSDKSARFESFVAVIDLLKEKGHENFAIATKK